MKKIFVKDIKSGDSLFGELFAIKKYKRGATKNNRPYVDLVLSDCTGDLKAKIWSDDFLYCDSVKELDVVNITGTVGDFQGEKQLRITNLSKVEEYDIEDFLPKSKLDPDKMFQKIIEIEMSLKNDELKKLFKAFLNDKEVVEKYKKISAAVSNHHAYASGLLEHTCEMLDVAKSLVKTRPELNKELLLTGVVFHDIGKVFEYEVEVTVVRTTKGILQGHIFMGAELVKNYGKQYNLSDELMDELIHMMLSHHGKLEYGSPITPKTPEAIALYMIDDLSAKLNAAIFQIEAAEGLNSSFTEYHRALGTELYKSSLTE